MTTEDENIIDERENLTAAGNIDPAKAEITYNPEKDFYKGMSGELRFKAEGLFKKAREKGISIEDIEVNYIRENQVEIPGLGSIELPGIIVKVKGRYLQNGQIMMDGKQIDYLNRYQKYMAERIEARNLVRDESGRVVRVNGRPRVKDEPELELSDWERFEIGKSLIEDKEFGLEKTITGACDRVIRKLMGENDWLYPGEARLLDEEYNDVQKKVAQEAQNRKAPAIAPKKATERQLNYLKAKIKNAGLDPESKSVMKEFLRQSGIEADDPGELSTAEASRLIDNFFNLLTKVKDSMLSHSFIEGAVNRMETGDERPVKQ